MTFLIGPRHSSGAHDSRTPLEVARSHEGVFSGGAVSPDSRTLAPKPLCHRHPTGPHPSGLSWTPAKGDPTNSNFALAPRLAGLRCRCHRDRGRPASSWDGSSEVGLVGRRQVFDDRRDVLLVDRRTVDLDHLGDLGLPEVLLELRPGRLGLDVVGRMAGAAIAL